MTQQEIAIAFSMGEFEKAAPYLADSASWVVVEEANYIGKQAILEQCTQVGNYFKSLTTQFKTTLVIAEANKVAVQGNATFIRDGKKVAYVAACDIYTFDQQGYIQSITSYCIPAK